MKNNFRFNLNLILYIHLDIEHYHCEVCKTIQKSKIQNSKVENESLLKKLEINS